MKVSKLKELLSKANDNWIVSVDADNDLVFNSSVAAIDEGEYELAYLSINNGVYRTRDEQGRYI